MVSSLLICEGQIGGSMAFFLIKAPYTSVLCRSRTGGAWAGGLAIVFLYLTDWKVIMGRVPYVKGRFK